MRATAIPPDLNGQPFRTVDAYALGVSLKTLQGSRFRRIAKGVYVAAATPDSHRLRVRGAMLSLPPSTIATGVTGLQLLGVDVGPEVPMACLALAGLPMPECNLVIGDDRGPIGRVDLVYLAYRLIIEYEGDHHRTDRNLGQPLRLSVQ